MGQYKSLACVMTLALAILFLAPFPAFADDDGSSTEQRYLNIATVDNRPISIDRLLHEALNDIYYRANITTTASLQQGYALANNGERDGVISSTPNMEQSYPNLIKVPVALDYSSPTVFLRADSKLTVNTWGDLSGLRVGILTQRVYIENSIPESASVTAKDTTRMILDGLANSEYDVVILSQRSHETIILPNGVMRAGVIETLPEYLYLNKRNANVVPYIAESLEKVFADGRGEKILSDIPLSERQRHGKKTILHILSYNTEIKREEIFNAKLKEPFKNDRSIEWYSIAFDLKRFSDDPNRLLYFANLLRRDCATRDVEAIVVSGEEALQFIKDYYLLFFRNTPVLFYSIGEDYKTIIEDYSPYFTGIAKDPSAFETVSMFLSLFPDTKNLYVVNDYTTEGKKYRKAIEEQLKPFDNLNIVYNGNVSRETLPERVAAFGQDTLVLVGSYFIDGKGQSYAQSDMNEFFSENLSAPVITLYSTALPYGAVGGMTMDYEKQGEMAADMLRRVLTGEAVDNIPVDSGSDTLNSWVFDNDELTRWGIKVKSLPENAIIINKHPSIWESDPRFAFTLVALLVLGLTAAAGTSFFFIRYRKQNELLIRDNKIREVKERLERIINSAPLAYMLSVDGIVTEINDYAEKYVGAELGVEAKSIYTDPNQRDDLIDTALTRDSVENKLVRLNMPDGGAHRFLSYVTEVEYDGRQGLILWAMDIEERENQKDLLLTTRQSLQTVLDVMPVPVALVDIKSETLVYANNVCFELFKYHLPTDLHQKHFSIFFPEFQRDGTASANKLAQILGTASSAGIEADLLDADGNIMDVRVAPCIIEYYGKKTSLEIFNDLDEENEYKRALMNAAEKEREANQLKSRFLVNMSHEIRTPMNVIIGLTEIELRKNPSKETKEIYKKINISAKNLLEIINDILDLSKIEADKIELFNDEFELEDVLNSALLVAAPRLDGKNVEFMLNASLDLPRFVIGDKTRLWQVLKNFLDNSAKYTDNGKIVLTAFANGSRSDEQTVTITFIIEDTGIGIDEAQMQKLFMPYEQIRNDAQKKYTGTGLGMAISKQLCEIMGGDLQVESIMGTGTTVIINIPFKRSQNSETEMQAVQSSPLAGLNILAADDDKLSLGIMEMLLEGINVNYVPAKSGTEAMEIILKWREMGKSFDLILLDYKMEGLNGFETARQIHLALSKTPKLLMVTAHQKMLLKHELEEGGIDDVIEKPFIPSQFISKLQAALGYGDSIVETEEPFTRFRDVNVLLCEDYRLNQEVATGMFAQFGIVADIAENGAEAIEILNGGKAFDLIFMDLQMPVMDGYEATRIIRADSRFDDIPIISLTADAMKEIVDRCLEMGMNDHVAKPIEFDNLQRVFMIWLPEGKRVIGEAAQLPVFDPSNAGLSRFGGDEELYRKALLEFTEMFPVEWPDFVSAVKNADETGKFIHKLKGAAGNLSEDEIYRCATEFESSLRVGNPDKDLYNQLIDACDTARTRILMQEQDTGDIPSDVPAKAGTIEEFTELLNRLEDAIQNCDPIACSDTVDSLREKSWPSSDEQKLQALYGLVKKYEFDAALQALDSIRVDTK